LTAVNREFEFVAHFAYAWPKLRLSAWGLRKYFAQDGTSIDGLGQFLQRNDIHLTSCCIGR
jgi:hypothetical protein